MSRGRHPKSAVAAALAKAKKAGLEVREDHNGHRWGWIICPGCPETFKISGTPRNPETLAQRVETYLQFHQHEAQEGVRD